MQDLWVIREFILLDFLIYCLGFGGGVGDSMFWLEFSGFFCKEIIYNLCYLMFVSSFCSEYVYSNVMYIIVGEVVVVFY